jgi:hypothetical protein
MNEIKLKGITLTNADGIISKGWRDRVIKLD